MIPGRLKQKDSKGPDGYFKGVRRCGDTGKMAMMKIFEQILNVTLNEVIGRPQR